MIISEAFKINNHAKRLSSINQYDITNQGDCNFSFYYSNNYTY